MNSVVSLFEPFNHEKNYKKTSETSETSVLIMVISTTYEKLDFGSLRACPIDFSRIMPMPKSLMPHQNSVFKHPLAFDLRKIPVFREIACFG